MRGAFLKAAAVACLVLSGTAAHATDFIFTFGTDLTDPNIQGTGAVPGTVTGRIIGLTDDATSSAQSVFIDIYSPSGGPAIPVDARLWFSQFENSFTVQNGDIVAAIFHADADFSASLDRLYINVPIYGSGGTNYASLGSNNSNAVWNNQGLLGITFTRIDTAVPEPATWAMMLIGFGAVGFAVRRTRRRSLGLA
jgi:hypothetical protein